MEAKPLNTDKIVCRSILTNSVLSEIHRIWPERKNTTIYVQQGNDPAHISVDDIEIVFDW